jgi:hypothetical protein
MNNTSRQEFVNWLVETPSGGATLWVLERTAAVVGALVALFIIYSLEMIFAPVVTNWKVDSMHRIGNHFIVSGTMEKRRACELISTSVLAVPKAPLAPRHLIYQVHPDEIIGGNAPTGSSTWGPWQVPIPQALIQHRDQIAFLEIVGQHRCHLLWTQETLYGRVPAELLP